MSNFKIPNSLGNYISKNDIDLAVQILNVLKGKTVSEIRKITFSVDSIAKENSKLL